jgi:hypothetical protein
VVDSLSQPLLPVIVFHPFVLIVRTPLLIVLFHVCVLPLFVAIVTIPASDSLLSTLDYCSLLVYCSVCLVYSSIVLCLYCLLPPIVPAFLLSFTLYCSLRFTALDGLAT